MKKLKWYNGKVKIGDVPGSLWQGHIGKDAENWIVACTLDGHKIYMGLLIKNDGTPCGCVNPGFGFELDEEERLTKHERTRIIKVARAHGWHLKKAEVKTPKVKVILQDPIPTAHITLLEDIRHTLQNCMSKVSEIIEKLKENKEE